MSCIGPLRSSGEVTMSNFDFTHLSIHAILGCEAFFGEVFFVSFFRLLCVAFAVRLFFVRLTGDGVAAYCFPLHN